MINIILQRTYNFCSAAQWETQSLFGGPWIFVKCDSSVKCVYENNLLSICFELSLTEGCCFLSRFAKLLRWMAVGGCAHMSMFTPISDSSEAVGHLMLSVEPRPSLHTGSKVHPFPQGSHHVLTTSWLSEQREKSRPVRWDTTKKKWRKKKDGTQICSQARVRPVKMPPCSLVWRSGERTCRVVQNRAACFQLQEELIVLETDEAQAQLDCKGSAARWESSLPALSLIDGKIISAAY